jgi:hypothetical protein
LLEKQTENEQLKKHVKHQMKTIENYRKLYGIKERMDRLSNESATAAAAALMM